MSAYATARRCAQFAVAAGFCLLPWAALKGFAGVCGSLFALDIFGLPFADPVAAAQATAAQAVTGGQAPAGALLLGAALSLALALLLGRVFCSWVCPYGLLSELAHACAPRSRTTEAPEGRRAHTRSFLLKAALLVLALGVFACWAFPLPALLSLPGELSLVPLLITQGGDAPLLLGALALPVTMLVLEWLTGTRLWCRHVCPQSVLLGGAAACAPKALPALRIGWDAQHCTCKGAPPCAAACPLGLQPRQPAGPPRRDCTLCGECLNACATHGKALGWRGTAPTPPPSR